MIKNDIAAGEGVNVTFFTQGCHFHCLGCHNPQTWSKDSGIPFDDNAKLEIFEELEKDYVTGLTLSGGDPLAKSNRNEILDLMIEVKDKFPNKDIWCYTGYELNEIRDLEHIKYIDVLVDGKFEKELSIPSPKWCGSSNQKVIYLK